MLSIDWSSDVCSSVLRWQMRGLNRWLAWAGTMLMASTIAIAVGIMATGFLTTALYLGLVGRLGLPWAALVTGTVLAHVDAPLLLWERFLVDRTSVVKGQSVSARVVIGGRRIAI